MRALVIGLGKSGRGAAKLLLQKGYEVLAVDRRKCEMAGVAVYPENAPIQGIDLVVLSPGVSRDHPLARGDVIGEAELAFRVLKNRMVGITGTNGKTTTTLLVTHVLNRCGMRARALGNVGSSLAEYACHPNKEEILVVELSSYQLETLKTRRLEHGLITNISPDHLDRYPSYEDYIQIKWHLKDLVMEGGSCFFGDDLGVSFLKNEPLCREIGLKTVEGAWALCEKLGVSAHAFIEALKTFKKPPHRMEFVGVFEGVRWINDSKGTNLASVSFGVSQVKGPLFLIAGGRAKSSSFKEWKTTLQGKVKGVFAIGEAAEQIEKELEKALPVWQCGTLKEAVLLAQAQAKGGDTVLLSPGCASFDQFRDFEERGERFKEYITGMKP